MAIKPIQILINAKDNASSVFSSLQARVAAVGAAIAGFFSIRAFSGAVQGAAELQAKLSEVQAVSGATADELVALRAAAEAAGASTKFTATEAADALGNLARAGLDANSAIEALPSTLSLAQAGNLSLADSSSIMTRALAGFNLAAEESGRVADVLAKGANSANTTVTGLGQALSFAAPTAVSLGLSLEDTVAIIGKFADAGIDAGRAGTALNSILAQFSNPASKFRSELAAAGITTTDFNQALSQLGAAGPAGQKAILAVGQEAGPALRALLNQGIDSLDELRASLLGAEGAAKATADAMENNLQGASRGLASAWDTVKNALATPVLPVLQQGVTQLANALRSAVSDGTVGRFGEAIAKGFQAALEAVKNFLSQVDFVALAATISGAAEKVGSAFGTMSEKAQTAGNRVKTIWGVMAGGSNVLLGVVYKIGEAFAGVASNIASGIALLSDGFAKISFGAVSQRFKEEADAIREVAGGLWASSEALAESSRAAFEAAADNARSAQDGFLALAGVAEQTVPTVRAAADALDDVAKKTDAVTKAFEAAAAAQQKKAQTDQAATAALATLRQEYASLIAKGDLQAAALKFEEINRALAKTPAAAQAAGSAAKATAEEVAAAFERMGVVTKEALAASAANAKRDFDIIKASGQATADGLQAAFQKYAEAAIAANGGVATDALRSEAAMRGLQIASDGAGKSIVRAMSTGKEAVQTLTGSLAQAQQAVQQLDGYMERLAKRNAEVKSSMVTDSQGFAADESGRRIVAGGNLTTLTGIAAFLKAAGVDDDEAARSIAKEFANSQGEVQYFNNPGQIKYGGKDSTLSMALLKAAERYTFGGAGVGGAVGTSGSSKIPKQSREVTVNLNVNGNSYGRVATDDEGADTLQRLLDELGRGKRSAS